jgi:hypothetical protein
MSGVRRVKRGLVGMRVSLGLWVGKKWWVKRIQARERRKVSGLMRRREWMGRFIWRVRVVALSWEPSVS